MMSNTADNGICLFPKGMPKSKRLLDLGLVCLMFPIWGPLWFVTAIVVCLWIGRPLYFRQLRQGYRARPFQVLKFRTMTEERDSEGALKPDAERLGKAGRMLRSFSLDELPQLWIVLKGEMSLVGPRPLPVLYGERYSAFQRRRFEVYPGVTGYAQVRGRNRLDWEERFRLDVEYVEQRSFWGDLRILWKTAIQTLFRVYTAGEQDTLSEPFEPKGKS